MEFLPFRRPRAAPTQVLDMRPKHPGFVSDPITRPIEVVLRMCSDTASPASGGGRPEWFSKESTFRSVFLHKDDRTNITVLFDGVLSRDHWIQKYPVKVVEFTGGTDAKSIMFQIKYILEQPWSDETILYSLEDDYLHRPGWTTILREGLGPIAHPTLSFDYITLYDHRDKYEWVELYRELVSKIGFTQSVHWRTVPSTTNTWAALMWTFRSDAAIFKMFQNQDNEKFKTLTRLGRTVASCIPSWSTHVHPAYMAPCIDWENYARSLSVVNSREEDNTNEPVCCLPSLTEESSHLQ